MERSRKFLLRPFHVRRKMKQSKHPRLIALALSIAVLIVAGIIAVTMYKCQLFNEGTAVYETFIFTTIAAIAGGVAAFWAGMTVAIIKGLRPLQK